MFVKLPILRIAQRSWRFHPRSYAGGIDSEPDRILRARCIEEAIARSAATWRWVCPLTESVPRLAHPHGLGREGTVVHATSRPGTSSPAGYSCQSSAEDDQSPLLPSLLYMCLSICELTPCARPTGGWKKRPLFPTRVTLWSPGRLVFLLGVSRPGLFSEAGGPYMKLRSAPQFPLESPQPSARPGSPRPAGAGPAARG